MKLRYIQKEGILFWITGYTDDGNTENVLEITRSLLREAYNFACEAKCKVDDVHTIYVSGSNQYDKHRVFYVRKCEEDIPAGTPIFQAQTLSSFLYPK